MKNLLRLLFVVNVLVFGAALLAKPQDRLTMGISAASGAYCLYCAERIAERE